MAMAEADLKSRILELIERDHEFRLSVAGLVGLKEVLERLEEHDRKFEEILMTLREHSLRFEEHDLKLDALNRKLDALGARWGIFSEQAFREGMRGVVEQYFDGKVERWIYDDEEGVVFGHPSKVEADLIVKDKQHLVIEIKSSISKSDISTLLRIGTLYEKVKRVKPKLAIVSPFVDDAAKETAKALGIPVFTRT